MPTLPINITANTSFLPSYDAPLEQHKECLRQCVPLMTKNNIPPDPINYAIWYEYVSGRNVQLIKEVDALVRDKKTFTSDISMRLYKTHICNVSVESFEKINGQLHQLINQTALAISSTNDQASLAGDHFTVQSQTLEAIQDQASLQAVLSEIIRETKQFATVSNALKEQLNNTQKEIEQLRDELSQVREIAKTDALTGLLNRRAFDHALNAFVTSCSPQNGCLILWDLDHFKRINDTHGHLVGDKVLRFFSSLLQKYVAVHHQVARYGGEELAIIMSNTSLAEALTIAEQIRNVMETSRLRHKGNADTIGKVTVSSGVAVLKVGDTAESIIGRADAALYRAKETGRNKIVVENAPCS